MPSARPNFDQVGRIQGIIGYHFITRPFIHGDEMNKQTYQSPSLSNLGSIEALTGTFGKCVDIIPGNDKGAGGPSDLDWRFLFLACDLPGDEEVFPS